MKFGAGRTPVPAGPGPRGWAASENRRLIYMIGGLFVVLGILVSSLIQSRLVVPREAPQTLEDESASAPALVAQPEIDVERLEALVADADPADQVVLESEAADLLLAAARRYTGAHFAALDTPELDAERVAALESEPAAHRAEPCTARGWIDALRLRSGAAFGAEYLGRLRLEDGSVVHFLVPEASTDGQEEGGAPVFGDFVRIDGLFLKIYRTEVEEQPGTWLAGPLLVGSRMLDSAPAFGPVVELDARILSEVEDAVLGARADQEPNLVLETPAEPFWHLMAYARDLPADALDWSAAPELDQRLLDELLERPADWRAQPIRIPISRLQDGRVKLAGENPARIERYTQGWIGNTTWKNVLQFKTPLVLPDLHVGDLVRGQGFFLHDFAYESAERGLRVAPVFVLHALERHVPRTSPVFAYISWSVAGMGAFLTVLFIVLLRRDKRRSEEFQAALVQRRRARRGGTGTVGPGTAAPG